MKFLIFIAGILFFFYVIGLFSNKKKIRNSKKTLKSKSKIKRVVSVKKVIKQKSKERIEYEKKYSDIGLDIPKARKHSYLKEEIYKKPIISRIVKFDITKVKSGKLIQTNIYKLLTELIINIPNEISDLKISGLNGPAKRSPSLLRISRELEDRKRIFFDKSIYTSSIAKFYSIEFRPQNWDYKAKLKTYDDWFKDRVKKNLEVPPFENFVKDIINPIGDEIFLKYKNILEKYSFNQICSLKLSPPYGQKIRIIVCLKSNFYEFLYFNKHYLTDYAQKRIKEAAGIMNELFKEKNISLHHCYEDSVFREEVIRLVENKLRKKNNMPLIGEGWANQTDLYNRLKEKFKEVKKEYSPNWLKPKRIDIYISKYKVAIEYHGFQHYYPTEFFGGEDAFIKRQKDDEEKRIKCLKNKSSYVEWPYDLEINSKNVEILSNHIQMNYKKGIYSINIKEIIPTA